MKGFFCSVLRFLAMLFMSGAIPFAGLSAWILITPIEILRKQPHLLIINSVLLVWFIGSSALAVAFDHYEERRKRM